MLVLGVDVAKEELAVSLGSRVWKVGNTQAGIARLLKGLDPETVIALESTGSLHLKLADIAKAAGFRVYVLNPKHIKRYRETLPVRSKSDALDASLIADYAQKEHERLRLYKPLPVKLRRLKALIGRRAKLVGARGKVRQSLQDCPELQAQSKALLDSFDKALACIDELIAALADSEEYKRVQEIPGIGKLTGAGILAAYSQGEFRSADAFIAFLGLDLVANDSGQKRGKRRLSKLGSSEARRLVYMSAMSGIRTQAWKPIYQGYRTRLCPTQAIVALGRRIARTAWSMLTHQTSFQKNRIQCLT